MISVKFHSDVIRWPAYQNGVETLPKISIAGVGCTNVADRRQTDGPTMIANVNVNK